MSFSIEGMEMPGSIGHVNQAAEKLLQMANERQFPVRGVFNFANIYACPDETVEIIVARWNAAYASWYRQKHGANDNAFENTRIEKQRKIDVLMSSRPDNPRALLQWLSDIAVNADHHTVVVPLQSISDHLERLGYCTCAVNLQGDYQTFNQGQLERHICAQVLAAVKSGSKPHSRIVPHLVAMYMKQGH